MDVGQCPQPARELDVPASFSAMDTAIEHLETTISELCDKLIPITRQEPATSDGGPNISKVPNDGTCQLSTRVRELRGRIERCSGRLRLQMSQTEI